MEAELVGMSFSNAENRAYYVPVPANRDEALKIVNEFRLLYENENSDRKSTRLNSSHIEEYRMPSSA